MTREEAIDYNKNLRMYMRLTDKNQPCKFLEENYIALDMAIKALEQEPCEDAISRSETIKYLNTNMAWYDEDGEIADSDEKLKAITDLINGVPSAQPKTGHWVYKTVRGEKVPCCSRCGLDNGTHYEYNFCPECGAKMIETQESEE